MSAYGRRPGLRAQAEGKSNCTNTPFVSCGTELETRPVGPALCTTGIRRFAPLRSGRLRQRAFAGWVGGEPTAAAAGVVGVACGIILMRPPGSAQRGSRERGGQRFARNNALDYQIAPGSDNPELISRREDRSIATERTTVIDSHDHGLARAQVGHACVARLEASCERRSWHTCRRFPEAVGCP